MAVHDGNERTLAGQHDVARPVLGVRVLPRCDDGDVELALNVLDDWLDDAAPVVHDDARIRGDRDSALCRPTGAVTETPMNPTACHYILLSPIISSLMSIFYTRNPSQRKTRRGDVAHLLVSALPMLHSAWNTEPAARLPSRPGANRSQIA